MEDLTKTRKIVALMLIMAIILAIAALMLNSLCFNSQKSDAITALTSATDIGDIILGDYASRTDGMVFNGDNLDKLYKNLLGKDGATFNDIASAGVLTSQDIRDNNKVLYSNASKEIVLTMGGMKWEVTYLSEDRSGNLILTLWLASESTTARMHSYSGSAGSYPPNMYATSEMRVLTLNNGGIYATNNQTVVSTPASKSDTHKYAQFTSETAVGNFTEYIVAPEQVAWQETESAKISAGMSYNLSNDAYSKTMTGLASSYDWQSKLYYDAWKADKIWLPSMAEVGYTGISGLWKISQVQRANSKGSWTRSAREANADCWNCINSAGSSLNNSGDDNKSPTTTTQAARPAFHLNITMADQVAKRTLQTPTDVKGKIYNGSNDQIEDAPWYFADAYGDPNNMQVEYLNEAGTAAAVTPQNAGKYKVKFTLLNKVKYSWATDDGKDFRIIDLEILPKEVEYTLENNADKIPILKTFESSDVITGDTVNLSVLYTSRGTTPDYNSTDLPKRVGLYTATVISDNPNYTAKSPDYEYFELEVRKIPIPTISPKDERDYKGGYVPYTFVFNFEFNGVDYRSDIKLDRPSEFSDSDYTLKDDHTAAYAIKAGEYFVELTLADNVNTEWADGKGTGTIELPFKINPADLAFTISDGDEIDCTVNTTQSIDIEVATAPKGDDTVVIDLIATYNGGQRTVLYEGWELTAVDDGDNILLDLDISKLIVEGKWVVKMVLRDGVEDNANYLLDREFVLNVQEEVEDGSDTWRIRVGKSNIGKAFKATGGTANVIFPDTVTYDGRTFEIYLKPSSFLDRTVNESYNDATGFVNGYKTELISSDATDVAPGKNAGKYKTSVMLTDSSGASYVYTITWEISKALFDLTNVKWENDGALKYTSDTVYAVLEKLPDGLKANYSNNEGKDVGDSSTATVTSFTLTGNYVGNYEIPQRAVAGTYIFKGDGDFEWTKVWEVVQAEIAVGKDTDWKTQSHTDDEGNTYDIYVLKDEKADGVVGYVYYETDSHGNISVGAKPIESLEDMEYSITDRKYYRAFPKILGNDNYKFPDDVEEKDLYSPFFSVGGGATAVTVSLKSDKIEYNGKPRNVSLNINGGAKASDLTLTYYASELVSDDNKLDGAPINKGTYTVVITSNKNSVVLSGKTQYTFEIIAATIEKDWNKNAKPYVLNLKYGQIDGIEYEIQDSEGNPVAYSDLAAGNKYQIKAKIKEDMQENYSFTDGTYETDWEEFELKAADIESMQDPNDPNNPHYPQKDDEEEPGNSDDNPPSGVPSGNTPDNNGGGGSINLDNVGKLLKEWWQVIASAISIVLIIIFLGKSVGYAGRSRDARKTAEKYKTSFFGATGLFGWAMTSWTIIACVLMGLAVVSLIIMIIMKNKCKKAEREAADGKDKYTEMMFMHMMGGGQSNGNMGGGYVFQQGLGAEEIRGIVSDTMTAMLPGMQQALPQQASTNDELVQRLLDENARSQEAIQDLMRQFSEQPGEVSNRNDDVINRLVENQELLMQKMSQTHIEKVVEKEVAASAVNDETIKQMMKTQENLMHNQEKLMEKILEMSATQPQPQVVEKVIEKEVPIEKIVEKEVKVEVPVEVEKVVEKEVVKEVKVEVPVEKIVEKEVIKEVKVAAPAKPKKEVAPRLTLDEAYAILSKQQQKYFDGLRQYALSKPNAKEKKSTYSITIGQSTVNPLLKLTIKKDMTVALFKMEDEYLKDIKRDATSDGTKVKVKETEVEIADAQACKVAKNMIDLREDQIERYNDLLKEQRAMNRKK